MTKSIDRLPTGGVTTPRGFRTAAMASGIKATALDLALIAADAPASAAAIFTTNLVKAAPVLLSRRHLETTGGTARAIVVNSGCANACTGEQGLSVATQTAAEAARLLGCPAEQVLVASTGVIGVALDFEKVRAGLNTLTSQLGDHHHQAARAIMTTDTGPKECAVRVTGPSVVTGAARRSRSADSASMSSASEESPRISTAKADPGSAMTATTSSAVLAMPAGVSSTARRTTERRWCGCSSM